MRSLRLVAAVLALALVAAACSDDSEENGEAANGEVTTTTRSGSTTSTTQPRVTTPTTEPPEATTDTTAPDPPDPPELPGTTTTPPPSVSVGPPAPPSDVSCEAGARDGELLVEFDALTNPSDISKIRVYVSVDGGPMITNGEFDVGQVDTARDGGSRWAARARNLPANVPLRVTATSFNQLGQESGWYIVEGLYTAAGAPCGAAADVVLPPTTCTAGCDEEEGEPGA